MQDFEKRIMDAFGGKVDDDNDVDLEKDVDVDNDDDQGNDSYTDNDDTDADVDNDDNQDDADADDDNGSGDGADKKKVLLNPDNKQDDTDSDFNTKLAEISKGRFKTFEEVEKALTSAPENTFANETVAKFNEFVKQGGDPLNFLKAQTVDYSKMSDIQIIKEARMMEDDSGLSESDIELLLTEEFGVDPKASEQAKQLALLKMKRAANSARKALEGYREKWLTPQASQEDIAAANAAESARWNGVLSSTADSVGKIDIDGGGDVFEYAISNEIKGSIKENYKDLRKFWDRYKNPDGSENVQKFVSDMIKLDNFDNIVKSIAAFYKGAGKKEIVDDIKNPKFKGKGQPPKDGKKSILDQVGENIFM